MALLLLWNQTIVQSTLGMCSWKKKIWNIAEYCKAPTTAERYYEKALHVGFDPELVIQDAIDKYHPPHLSWWAKVRMLCNKAVGERLWSELNGIAAPQDINGNELFHGSILHLKKIQFYFIQRNCQHSGWIVEVSKYQILQATTWYGLWIWYIKKWAILFNT